VLNRGTEIAWILSVSRKKEQIGYKERTIEFSKVLLKMESVGVVPKGEKHMRYLTVLFLTAALAGIASAEIQDCYVDSYTTPETDDALSPIPADTYVTNDIYFECDSDWLSAVLIIVPDAGAPIYEHAAGSEQSPNPLFFPVYAALEYDTYISTGVLNESCATGTAADFGYTEKIFTTSLWALTYYTDITDDIGTLALARVTLENTCNGYWQYRATAEPASDPENGFYGPMIEILEENRGGGGMYGDIVNGELIIVPEPATLGLLLIGGLGVWVRRKR
jgi:hypothetical protein